MDKNRASQLGHDLAPKNYVRDLVRKVAGAYGKSNLFLETMNLHRGIAGIGRR